MTEMETKVRRWGNSFGIIIPHQVMQQTGIREGEEIKAIILHKKKADLSKVFGSLKKWKIDTQKLKDELREGWE